ncbi:hypothetical protein OG252_12540 [Streptomyces sp. NBC_01352]|nr:hypothetical protein [Streptomyces sp. NBC_01352]
MKRHNADGTGGEVLTDFEGGDDQAHAVAMQDDEHQAHREAPT